MPCSQLLRRWSVDSFLATAASTASSLNCRCRATSSSRLDVTVVADITTELSLVVADDEVDVDVDDEASLARFSWLLVHDDRKEWLFRSRSFGTSSPSPNRADAGILFDANSRVLHDEDL